MLEQGDTSRDDYDSDSTSIERSLSDIEIVRSAYPDETESTFMHQHHDNFKTHYDDNNDSTMVPTFPLHLTLYLSSKRQAYIVFEWNQGYPTHSPLHISVYRDENNHGDKQRIERTVHAVRTTATECYEDGIEAGLACCSIALETWNDYDTTGSDTGVRDETLEAERTPMGYSNVPSILHLSSSQSTTNSMTPARYQWLTNNEGNMIHDRKSFFLGHVCTIRSESDVKPAIQYLIFNNNKLQRATHHMVRFSCVCVFYSLMFLYHQIPLVQLIPRFSSVCLPNYRRKDRHGKSKKWCIDNKNTFHIEIRFE